MTNRLYIYSVLITVNRPPTHFSTKLLHSENKPHAPTTNPVADTAPNLSHVTGNTIIIYSRYLSKSTIAQVIQCVSVITYTIV